MEEKIGAVRLKLEGELDIQGTRYTIDALAIEVGPTHFDFRLELGLGYDIYWLIPFESRLRLFHVDSAVYEVEEPTMHADHVHVEVPRRTWPGPAGTALGIEVADVVLELTPTSFHCEAVVRVRGEASCRTRSG